MNLDESVFRALNHAGSNLGVDLAMVALTVLGMTYILVLAGPILWLRGRRELGFDVVVLLIITGIVVEVLKLLIMRERPFQVLPGVHTLPWGPLVAAGGYSMPSGHASQAFAVATLIALGTSRQVGAVVLVLAALISLSRIYLGVHWPSDVLAGALLGVGLALIMRWASTGDNAYTRSRGKVITWLRRRGQAEGKERAAARLGPRSANRRPQ